jgi:RNA polymerase sigma-70 factor (ECF subfamily)
VTLDTDAFERETLRYLPDVLRFAQSLARDPVAAEDLVQETYLRAYKARETFKPEMGARQWLFTICRNVFLRGKEREKWTVASLDDPEGETLAMIAVHEAAQEGGYEDLFDRLDFGPALQRAMDMLAEPFRVVFALVDIGGLEYAEAAKELGIPVGTVRSRLFRARRELQQSLVEFGRDAGFVPPEPPTAGRT